MRRAADRLLLFESSFIWHLYTGREEIQHNFECIDFYTEDHKPRCRLHRIVDPHSQSGDHSISPSSSLSGGPSPASLALFIFAIISEATKNNHTLIMEFAEYKWQHTFSSFKRMCTLLCSRETITMACSITPLQPWIYFTTESSIWSFAKLKWHVTWLAEKSFSTSNTLIH